MSADLNSDHSTAPVVYIAKCAEHGLHGERDECFVCGKPVEHVAFVRADQFLQIRTSADRALKAVRGEATRLHAENERLREELTKIAERTPGRSVDTAFWQSRQDAKAALAPAFRLGVAARQKRSVVHAAALQACAGCPDEIGETT